MNEVAEVALRIDGKDIKVRSGLTVLEAARQNGIRIPTLCHHEALSPYGGCRLCVVEVDGAPRLAASCVTPVRQGMEVVTVNDRIIEARRTVLAFLFSEKPHYCMYCAQSGDCELQALAYEYQLDFIPAPSLMQDFPVDASHHEIVIDHNRCILCGRCVRACRELAGQYVLDFNNRGGRVMIGADLSEALGESSCVSCGLCLQFCPTGAIFQRHSTHYAVKGKSKAWRAIESRCSRCGLLCPVTYHVRDNNLLKVEGRILGDGTDKVQLCRKGRFEPLQEPPRQLKPMVRENGSLHEAGLESALDYAVRGLINQGGAPEGGLLAGLISSGCSNEELTAFRDLLENRLRASYVDIFDGAFYRTWSAVGADVADWSEAPWNSLLEADLILYFGASPLKTHPVVAALTRKAVLERKARLVIIARQNDFAPLGELFLPASSDELERLLDWLAEEAKPLVDAGTAKENTDVLEELLNRIAAKDFSSTWTGAGLPKEWYPGLQSLARALRKSKHVCLVVGEECAGLERSAGLRLAYELTGPKCRNRSAGIIILKPEGNSAGAWKMGLPSRRPPKSSEAGLRLMVCLDRPGEADHSLPGKKHLDFLVALTPYASPSLDALADVVIPVAAWLEKDGSYTGSDGLRVIKADRILVPPPEVLTVEEVVAEMDNRLGAWPAGAAQGR